MSASKLDAALWFRKSTKPCPSCHSALTVHPHFNDLLISSNQLAKLHGGKSSNNIVFPSDSPQNSWQFKWKEIILNNKLFRNTRLGSTYGNPNTFLSYDLLKFGLSAYLWFHVCIQSITNHLIFSGLSWIISWPSKRPWGNLEHSFI